MSGASNRSRRVILTERDVCKMRKERAMSGESTASIAKRYGVSMYAAMDALSGKSWSHVLPDAFSFSKEELYISTRDESVHNPKSVSRRRESRLARALNEDPQTVGLRPVPGFPGYFVTENGDVYSVRDNRKPGDKPTKMMPTPDRQGYGIVTLRVNGRQFTKKVCQLVAIAFHGPRPDPKSELRHLDGDNSNNRPDNLAWGTHAENVADRDRHGRTLVGSRGTQAVLNEEKVAVIKVRLLSGDTVAAIARDYGVARSTIRWIARGRTWKHVVAA
jgi:hypothetical protein